MKPSEYLFELVHALSKTEKRYFKRYTSLHGTTEKNYVHLFDEILKMQVYDEGKVKRKYAGGYADNFGMLKQLLFQQVMKSLSSFYADSSIEHEILSIIREIKILQKKGLYPIAEKKIDKGIKLSLEHERLGFLPILYSHKKSNLYQSFFDNTSYEEIEEIVLEEQHAFLLMNEIIVKVNIMLKFFYLRVVSAKTKIVNNKAETDSIVSQLLLEKKKSLSTFSAQSIRLHILATYYSDKGSAVKANNIMRQHINLYHNYPKIKKEYYFNFLNINYQLADLLITTQKFSEAAKHLEVLEQNKIDNKGYESLFFTLHYSALLKLYTETKEFSKALKLEKNITREKQSQNSNIPDEAQNHFNYCFAVSHFYLKNYDKAIHHLQNIINRKNNHSHFAAAKTLLFICHYELKNDNILLHLAEGALRAMNVAYKDNLPLEAILLDLFIKSTKANKSQQYIQDAKKYFYKKENKSSTVLEPFNVFEWIAEK
jgi:hypothetical protein